MSQTCIFCDIIAGKAQSSVLYENETVIAFMDTRPVNPGHLLIIPKQHAEYLADIDEATGMQLFAVAMRLQKALRESGEHCEGINLFLADGEAAGQEVFHVHLHIIPRFKGDAFRLDIRYDKAPSRDKLKQIAKSIRSRL